MATTFNPPYNETIDVQTGETTYADKDGKVVTLQEINDYSSWLEANPPAEEPAAITTSTEATPTA
jgi:hypothetical protein